MNLNCRGIFATVCIRTIVPTRTVEVGDYMSWAVFAPTGRDMLLPMWGQGTPHPLHRVFLP